MSAVISKCGNYRYRLDRQITFKEPGNGILFIGVNPSTADAEVDDQTIKKMKGFATKWCCDHFTVVNLFAYRSTDVNELAKIEDPEGPLNGFYVQQALDQAKVIVPCWGSRHKLPKVLWPHVSSFMFDLRMSEKVIRCFGKTKSGDPKHPLILGYQTKLEKF